MTNEWRIKYAELTKNQKEQVDPIIFNNIFTDETIGNVDAAVREVLKYYQIRRYGELPEPLTTD